MKKMNNNYLSYEEYTGLVVEPVDEENFNKLIKAAVVKLDLLTNYFYQKKDFDSDFEKRKNAFKTALAYQIDYYHFYGATSSYQINNSQTVTIGRTSLSDRNNNEGKNTINVPTEVLSILGFWGFLYKGVDVKGC